jgi:hypothetical protein
MRGIIRAILEISAVQKCAADTPVPGGVGPMTRICLIRQTVEAAREKYGTGKNRLIEHASVALKTNKGAKSNEQTSHQ